MRNESGKAKLHVWAILESGKLVRVHRKGLLWLQAMPYMACTVGEPDSPFLPFAC